MTRISSKLLSAGLAVVAAATFAANAFAETIGTVDFEKLMASYNKAQAFQDDMKIRERELEKLRAEYAKQLRETKTGQPNNPVALDQMEKDLQGKFAVKMNESRDWMMAKTKEIDTEVNNAITTVAATRKLDLVVAKQFVFHGGTDITNDVLSKLNTTATK